MYFHSDDGRIIPAGANASFNFNVTFRDPKYFPDPNTFNPERFTAERLTESKMNPFAYIPFSAGMRNCIGQKFAMLEIKAVISKLLRNFELLQAGEEPDMLIELITRSRNGIQMGIKPRSHQK